MNIIKLILALIGLLFVGIILFWAIGIVSSVIWYLFWLAVIGGVGYGAYRAFRKVEDKVLGTSARSSQIGDSDINMSWDEYDRKYLHK
jgi:hypothetical protein